MSSVVEICNAALAKIGSRRITSLEDESSEGRICKALYAITRDEMLEEFDWRFATARLELAADVDEPISDWGYQYTLPTTVMRVLRVDDGSSDYTIDWEVEGRKVMAGITPIYVLAVQRVDDPTQFPSLFASALAFRLAAEICTPLTENEQKTQRLLQMAAVKVRIAQNRDGGQGRMRVSSMSTLTSARYGSTFNGSDW